MSDYPAYKSAKADKKNALAAEIATRAPFRYDPEKDLAYQSYKAQYMRQGKQAMKDTQGQAAALTGGYGSTYAENAGYRAYENYLGKLNDVLPELEGKAYQRYKDKGDELRKQYGLLSDEEEQEYQRYLDAYRQWQDEQNRATEAEEREYKRKMEAEAIARQQEQTAYDREQDALKRQDSELSRKQSSYANLYKLISEYGYRPTDDELNAAGMSRGQADALANAWAAANAPQSSGTSGSGSGSRVVEILKPLIGSRSAGGRR